MSSVAVHYLCFHGAMSHIYVWNRILVLRARHNHAATAHQHDLKRFRKQLSTLYDACLPMRINESRLLANETTILIREGQRIEPMPASFREPRYYHCGVISLITSQREEGSMSIAS